MSAVTAERLRTLRAAVLAKDITATEARSRAEAYADAVNRSSLLTGLYSWWLDRGRYPADQLEQLTVVMRQVWDERAQARREGWR